MKKQVLQPSVFNHTVPHRDGGTLLYNVLWRTMILLSDDETQDYEELVSAKAHPFGDGSFRSLDVSLLRQLRVLIPVGFDELEFLRQHYYASMNRPVLTAMILPTLRCNFACPYCFEYRQEVDMSEAMVEALKKRILGRLPGKRHFHITWFGGEPLLAMDHIMNFSHFGLTAASERNIEFSSSLVTNGYLLDPSNIAAMQAVRILNFHITLDGDQEDHDGTRYLPNGTGTFEDLRDKIETYCSLSKSHLPLGLRVNVTDRNLARLPQLFARFSDRVKQGSRLYFRWVWTTEASGRREFVAERRRPFEALAGLYEAAASAGFRIENPIDPIQFNYCEVDFAHHFTFDPLGYIYLCSHTFRPEEAIGHVVDNPNIEGTAHYRDWLQTNPFSDNACLKCKILPLCKGGCRKARMNGSRPCIEEKASLDDYVQTQYAKTRPLRPQLSHDERLLR